MVAIGRLTGRSSGLLSVYALPPNWAVSIKSPIKINKRRRQSSPKRHLNKIVINMSASSPAKITVDAVHLLVGFGMNKAKKGYQPQRVKLIDMPGVKTHFKAEINTSNPKFISQAACWRQVILGYIN